MVLYPGAKVKEDMKEVKANYDSMKEWKYDKNGYFLIRVNRETKEIEAGFCKQNNEVEIHITGKHPEEMYNTIVREDKLNLVGLKEHAAYLGMEFQKAYTALKLGIEYVQDEDLDYDKKFTEASSQQPSPSKQDEA